MSDCSSASKVIVILQKLAIIQDPELAEPALPEHIGNGSTEFVFQPVCLGSRKTLLVPSPANLSRKFGEALPEDILCPTIVDFQLRR